MVGDSLVHSTDQVHPGIVQSESKFSLRVSFSVAGFFHSRGKFNQDYFIAG